MHTVTFTQAADEPSETNRKCCGVKWCQARSRNEKIIRYWSNLNSCEHTESQNGYLLQVNYTSEAGSTEDTCVIIHSTARHNFPLYSYFTAQQQFLFIYLFFTPVPICCSCPERQYSAKDVTSVKKSSSLSPFWRHFSFFILYVHSIASPPPGSALNDGQWHTVEFHSRRGRLSIAVDQEERGSAQASHSFPVAAQSRLYFGGESGKRAPEVNWERVLFVCASKVFVVKFYVPHATFFQAGLNANIQQLLKADGSREPAKIL